MYRLMNIIVKRFGFFVLVCLVLFIFVITFSVEGSGRNDKIGFDYQIRWHSFSDHIQPSSEKNDATHTLELKLGVELIPIVQDVEEAMRGRSRLHLLLAEGSTPDVFSILSYYLDDTVLQSCLEITMDEIRTYMPDVYMGIEEVASEWGYGSGEVWDRYRIHGKLYFIPQISPRESLPRVILWRKDVLDELGKAVPKTIDEWEDILRAYRLANPSKVGYMVQPSFLYEHEAYLFSATGVYPFDWIEHDNRLIFGLMHPDMRLALETWQRWYMEGYVRVYDLNQFDWLNPHTFFINGDTIVTMIVRYKNGNWICNEPYYGGSVQERCKVKNPEAEFVISPPPVFQIAEKPEVGLSEPFEIDGTPIIAFGKHLEKDRDKLHKIMWVINQIASDEELYLLANYGIEKTDWRWEKVGDERAPKRISEELDHEFPFYGRTLRFWALAYSRTFDDYLVHPRIRQSIEDICLRAGAPYSRENLAWSYSKVRMPYYPVDQSGIDFVRKAYDVIYYTVSDSLYLPLKGGERADTTFETFVNSLENNPTYRDATEIINRYYFRE